MTRNDIEELRKKSGQSIMSIVGGKLCFKIEDKTYVEKSKDYFEEIVLEKAIEAIHIIRPEKKKFKSYYKGKF